VARRRADGLPGAGPWRRTRCPGPCQSRDVSRRNDTNRGSGPGILRNASSFAGAVCEREGEHPGQAVGDLYDAVALIDLSDPRCAICDDELLDRPFTATWGTAFPEDHYLWPYCDAALHCDCLEKWEHRIEFAEGYYQRSRAAFQKSGTLLRETRHWLLGCGFDGGRVTYVQAVLRQWPLTFNAPGEQWRDYLTARYSEGLSGAALEVAESFRSDILAASVQCGLIESGDVD
jgi:hypothetical protein